MLDRLHSQLGVSQLLPVAKAALKTLQLPTVMPTAYIWQMVITSCAHDAGGLADPLGDIQALVGPGGCQVHP